MSELRIVADLMALAARTAPKSVGKDFVVIRIIEGDDVRILAEKMLEFGQQTGKVNFDRDGKNVAASDVVVLIGSRTRSRSASIVARAAWNLRVAADQYRRGRVPRAAVRLSAAGHGHCPGLRGENGQHTER